MPCIRPGVSKQLKNQRNGQETLQDPSYDEKDRELNPKVSVYYTAKHLAPPPPMTTIHPARSGPPSCCARPSRTPPLMLGGLRIQLLHLQLRIVVLPFRQSGGGIMRAKCSSTTVSDAMPIQV